MYTPQERLKEFDRKKMDKILGYFSEIAEELLSPKKWYKPLSVEVFQGEEDSVFIHFDMDVDLMKSIPEGDTRTRSVEEFDSYVERKVSNLFRNSVLHSQTRNSIVKNIEIRNSGQKWKAIVTVTKFQRGKEV